MHGGGLPGIYASYVINKSRPQVRDKPMTKVLHECAVAKVLILSFFFGASSHLFGHKSYIRSDKPDLLFRISARFI